MDKRAEGRTTPTSGRTQRERTRRENSVLGSRTTPPPPPRAQTRETRRKAHTPQRLSRAAAVASEHVGRSGEEEGMRGEDHAVPRPGVAWTPQCRSPPAVPCSCGAGAGAWRGHEVGVMRERRGGGRRVGGVHELGGTGRRECVREGGDEGRREERRRCWARKAGGFSRLPLGVVGSRLRFASVFSCWWSSVPTVRCDTY